MDFVSPFITLAQMPSVPVDVPTDPFTWLVNGFWAISVGLLAWYLFSAGTTATYVTLADGRRKERRLPLVFRLLLPWTPNIDFTKKQQGRGFERTRKKLAAAAYDGLITPNEFLALKILMPLVMGPVLILILFMLFQNMPGGIGEKMRSRQFIFYMLVMVTCWAYPNIWLNKMIAVRRKQISKAMPFILDLLTLSVEAGLDFMGALRRIVDRRSVDALGEELIRVFREIQLGKTRREALVDLGDRTQHPDVMSLVNALVQADELGVSIGFVLRIQADQMRQRRFQRAEEMANKAPVKMLFPLVCFIFPAVFLVLLGPVLLDVSSQGFGF